MTDLLIKPALDKTFPEQEFGGLKKPGILGRKDLQRIAHSKRSDGSRIHPAIRGRGHGISLSGFGGPLQARFNAAQKIFGPTQELIGEIVISKLFGEGSARFKTRDTPKIIPSNNDHSVPDVRR